MFAEERRQPNRQQTRQHTRQPTRQTPTESLSAFLNRCAIDVEPPRARPRREPQHALSTSAIATNDAVAAAMASLANASETLNTVSSLLSTYASGLSQEEREWPPLLSTAEAELTEAMLIPQFLSEADVSQLFEAASRKPHDLTYSPAHVALNLHRDGYLASQCPELASRITDSIRDHAHGPGYFSVAVGRDVCLNVRCVEFHTYTIGGHVMMQDHRDYGSVFTLSVLLSDPADFDGGELMTWREGQAEKHPMRRGDALLFHSEKVHNVAAVTRGLRNSLVIELWQGPCNLRDRYS
jgi:predicted 2-oxoglutarate/Fe(II)-dependent dioxygenase YbiX